jgi:hypothetical protein
VSAYTRAGAAAAYQDLDNLPLAAERLRALRHAAARGYLVVHLRVLHLPLGMSVAVAVPGTRAFRVRARALPKAARAQRWTRAVRERPKGACRTRERAVVRRAQLPRLVPVVPGEKRGLARVRVGGCARGV